MILTKEVEVKPTGKMIQYYKDKGYDAKCRKPLHIKVEDLPEHSDIIVEVLCDYCGENINHIKYSDYTKGIKNIKKYACEKCGYEKIKEVTRKLYGVESIFSMPEVKQKIRQTFLEKYNASSAMCSDEIKSKSKQTTMAHFGVEYPSQSPSVQKKIRQSFYKNGTTPTSCQQLYIFNLYKIKNKAELNYPISRFNADICFLEEKLIIEVDFGGHNLQVKLGVLTQEEFDKKEIIRNAIIKKEGYKQMRIISSKNLLPNDSILLQMLETTRQYFLDYPEHSWCSYDIDQSMLFNAKYKDGILYDYGELRTIKECNLNTKETTSNVV